jgi:hypothetical protein
MTVMCPYCNKPAIFTSSARIFGKHYGMIYLCEICEARVGTHKNSDRPLGTMANAELRKLRSETHKVFDKIWLGGKIDRSLAYRRLAKQLEINTRACHIGMFDVKTCKKVINLYK